MFNSQLLSYITQRLKQGASRGVIQNDLLSAGWKEEDINGAFSYIESQQSSLKPSLPNDSRDFSRFFQEPDGSNNSKAAYYESDAPKIIQWLVKYSGGIIKTETQAMAAIVALSTVFMGLIIFFTYQYYFNAFRFGGLTPEMEERIKNCKPPECAI